jgi:hypothetical protein
MANPEYIYPIEERVNNFGTLYTFVSKGERDIIKVVAYSFVQSFSGKDIYNLGFADYDAASDRLLDETNSNNGDHYRVFNTVLNTIPVFFGHFPAALMVVRGSDSKPDFVEQCRLDCTRRCFGSDCRKGDRRINIYRRYVDQNFEKLSADYTFYGGQKNIENETIIQPYAVGEKYDAVFVSKKFVHL